jgi:hypothetical protein
LINTSSIIVDEHGCTKIVGTFFIAILRPGILELLHRLKQTFNLAVCSFGSRSYIAQVVSAMDPDGTLFGDRILDRIDVDPYGKKYIPESWGAAIAIDDQPNMWNSNSPVIKIDPLSINYTDSVVAPSSTNTVQLDSLYVVLVEALELCDYTLREHGLTMTCPHAVESTLQKLEPSNYWHRTSINVAPSLNCSQNPICDKSQVSNPIADSKLDPRVEQMEDISSLLCDEIIHSDESGECDESIGNGMDSQTKNYVSPITLAELGNATGDFRRLVAQDDDDQSFIIWDDSHLVMPRLRDGANRKVSPIIIPEMRNLGSIKMMGEVQDYYKPKAQSGLIVITSDRLTSDKNCGTVMSSAEYVDFMKGDCRRPPFVSHFATQDPSSGCDYWEQDLLSGCDYGHGLDSSSSRDVHSLRIILDDFDSVIEYTDDDFQMTLPEDCDGLRQLVARDDYATDNPTYHSTPDQTSSIEENRRRQPRPKDVTICDRPPVSCCATSSVCREVDELFHVTGEAIEVLE